MDVISRKAAIDALMEFDKELRKINWYQYPYTEHECRGVDEAIIKITNLPSAQSERQKGEWIDHTEDGYVECPFCHGATNCDGNKDELHFCFSCGADMRGKQDGKIH